MTDLSKPGQVGAIPNSIINLTFGSSFNQDIKGAIPNLIEVVAVAVKQVFV